MSWYRIGARELCCGDSQNRSREIYFYILAIENRRILIQNPPVVFANSLTKILHCFKWHLVNREINQPLESWFSDEHSNSWRAEYLRPVLQMWIRFNPSPLKCGMKLIIHSQISAASQLK